MSYVIVLDIANLTIQKIEKNFLEEAATRALQFLNQKNASVSLVLVGVGRIRQLNKTWRGRNRVTDVLAFANKEQRGREKFIAPKKFDNFLGEIFICLPQAKKQAKKLGHSLKNELTLLFTHGILHLVGYEDEGTVREREEMERKQRNIIKKLT